MELLDEMERQGIRYVPAREEGAACFMAAADARLSGAPGVVVVTTAPGLTAAVNGVANAFLDRLPLLIISGQHDAEKYPVTIRQALDGHTLLSPITKWTARVSTRVNQVMARAIDTAVASPPGPVFLEIRSEVARASATDNSDTWPSVLTDATDVKPTYTPAAVAGLTEQLAHSSRPVLVVGSRVNDAAVGLAVAHTAESLNIPAFTTPSAKGLLPFDGAWNAGTFLNGNPESGLVDKADLIVVAGFDANDIFNAGWRYEAPVVALENDRSNTQHYAPTTTQFVGDIEALLHAAVDSGKASKSRWEKSDVSDYRAGLLSLLRAESDGLTISGAIRQVRAGTPPDTLVAVDAGFGKPLMSYLWESQLPNSYFSSHGLSTMGYAIPAGVALKLGRPASTVVGFMGDGSFHMRASEIGVAADEGAGVIFVVWVDGALAQIQIKQRRKHLKEVGVLLPMRSTERIASAFGAAGYDVETRAELAEALAIGVSRTDAPTVIGVRADNTDRDLIFDALRG
jgi:acetolactate synthase-1/2/3 large subunit